MSIDLTQFHESFYDESFEALGSMEENLLRLDVGAPESDRVNTIFRVAHSIKGGAATFGFTEITSFTHTLETLLDELRAQRMQVTRALLDLLLKAVDVMRDMLRAQQARQPIDAQRVADLQFDLELAVVQKGAAPAQAPAVVTPPAAPLAGFAIRFKPLLHLLARGNDPLRLFAELRQLGELRVQADLAALPALAGLDPENCHLAWRLELDTSAPMAAVAEVFDWAEGDCELAIEPLGAAPALIASTVARTLASIASALGGSTPILRRLSSLTTAKAGSVSGLFR